MTTAITIRLAPHCSLSPRGARAFFGSCCLTCLGVAGLMTLHGWWPVLPFAGGEMLLLGWVLSLSMRRRHCLETITVTEERIEIESVDTRGSRQAVFPRHWAQVRLRRAASPLHPSQLLIVSHGRSFEVGRFLTEDDRRGLAGRLGRSIGTVNQSPPLAG